MDTSASTSEAPQRSTLFFIWPDTYMKPLAMRVGQHAEMSLIQRKYPVLHLLPIESNQHVLAAPLALVKISL